MLIPWSKINALKIKKTTGLRKEMKSEQKIAAYFENQRTSGVEKGGQQSIQHCRFLFAQTKPW